MFGSKGLALMLLEVAEVDGRKLPPGSVGTEEDFGEWLWPLLRSGKLMAFDPRRGLPEVPPQGAYFARESRA